MVRGRIGPEEVTGDTLSDPVIGDLADRVEMIEDDHCNANFPDIRLASVVVVTGDGTRLESGWVQPTGDPDQPLSDDEITAKFHAYADPVAGAAGAARIRDAVEAIESGGLAGLFNNIAAAATAGEVSRTAAE
jgi:2-methylcitrate dehydratase PrpD